MGIFKKDKKDSSKEQKGKGKSEIKLTDLGEGAKMIEGGLPKGFDPSDKEQVKEFVKKALGKVGMNLPEGIQVEVSPVDLAKPGGLDKLLEEFHKGKGIESKLKKTLKSNLATMGGAVEELPLPQDPAKASFMAAYNKLHKAIHALAPLAKDLLTTMEVLAENVPKDASAIPQQEEAFQNFDSHVGKVVMAIASLGCVACELGVKVMENGIPVPDVSTTTVN